MIFGHPPPESQFLRARVIQRLTYLDDLLRGGLGDFVSSASDPDAVYACTAQIQQYVAQAEALLAFLPDGPGAAPDQVLMDVPVLLADEETGETESFTVVGPDEVDPAAGLISLLSPLGSALLLKSAGETVVLDAPGGRFLYRVVAIGAQAL